MKLFRALTLSMSLLKYVALGCVSQPFFRYIKRLITFDKDPRTNVINLSRIDPTLLVHKKLASASATNTYKYVYLRAQREPALAISLICVDEDYTKVLKSNGGPYESKVITGTPLSLEYERMVTVLCMVMGDTPFIRTQISDNRWTFSTRPLKIHKECQCFIIYFSSAMNLSDMHNLKRRLVHIAPHEGDLGLLQQLPAQQPPRPKLPQRIFTASRWVLATTVCILFHPFTCSTLSLLLVPVFDGRYKKIQLPRGLRTVPQDLPPFIGDIPFDSLAIVAYSAMSYKSTRHPEDVSAAFNAVWVVVLGSPNEKCVFTHTTCDVISLVF